MSELAEKLLAIHRAFDTAGIPHAFGGAIALAYCTGEPRATVDIDMNAFVGPAEAGRALGAFPEGVSIGHRDLDSAEQEGQVRLFWNDTPIDLFFSYHDFHEHAAERVRMVPFDGVEIPILACEDLVVLKTFFARTQDWADIEAVAAAGSVEDNAIRR